MKRYVCIDIGGTEIKHGIIDGEGRIVTRDRVATEAPKGGPHLLKKAMHLVSEYEKGGAVSGICVSTAGMVDVEKGEIFYAAPLIPDYTGTRLKAEMERAFHVRCEVENDVNCAGLAESVSGAAKGSRVSVCLTVGTGIGGCVLIDGKVFHGWSNSACEIGYMHLEGGEFQALGAASVLVRKVAERRGEPLEDWNGRRVFDEAKQGEPVCVKAIDEMCDVLGQGIANICYVINPETVVLGGGIMAQEEYLEERIGAALTRHLVPSIRGMTRLAFAEHGNDAGMLGAYYHFRSRS